MKFSENIHHLESRLIKSHMERKAGELGKRSQERDVGVRQDKETRERLANRWAETDRQVDGQRGRREKGA